MQSTAFTSGAISASMFLHGHKRSVCWWVQHLPSLVIAPPVGDSGMRTYKIILRKGKLPDTAVACALLATCSEMRLY